MAIPSRNKRKASSSPERQTQPPEPPHNPDVPSSSAADEFFPPPTTQPFVFPPGYKFVPKDEELIFHYLKPVSQGDRYSLAGVPIHHVNIYESNPQLLSEKYEKGNEKEWFFISERTKIGKGGGRGGRQKKRGSNGGYWSATVASKKINAGNGIVGYKTVLDYYVGKQPNGVKGDWLMQEYWLESSSSDDDDNNENKVDHALCKIYLTPRVAKKKKKSEEEANEKLKRREVVLKEEVVQLDLNQPQPQQPQYCELPAQDQKPLPQQLPFPSNLDGFSEFISFEQQPVIADVFEGFWTDCIKSSYTLLDGDEEYNNIGLFFNASSQKE